MSKCKRNIERITDWMSSLEKMREEFRKKIKFLDEQSEEKDKVIAKLKKENEELKMSHGGAVKQMEDHMKEIVNCEMIGWREDKEIEKKTFKEIMVLQEKVRKDYKENVKKELIMS